MVIEKLDWILNDTVQIWLHSISFYFSAQFIVLPPSNNFEPSRPSCIPVNPPLPQPLVDPLAEIEMRKRPHIMEIEPFD